MEDKRYTKLSELVGKTFTVEEVEGYKFKMWDAGTKKMVSEDKWFNGARKVYQVETDKGWLDLGSGQLSSLLEAVFKDGVSDINLATFEVKSNGKTGMDIRYYFNEVKVPEQLEEDLDDIPF
jgi:hypothetical protein